MVRRLALLLAGLLVADGILYLGLRRLDNSRIFYDRSKVTAHHLDYFAAHSYDPELGWDLLAGEKNSLGAGRRGDDPAGMHYTLKAFGDSFTFGSDVAHGETWPAQIEVKTGLACLNYGVPGYGPDQALLKYRRTAVKTEYSVLAVQEENIARVVNIYRAFYMEDWGPPKPRFFLSREGLRLEPNPIGRREEVRKLLDPAFVDSLRKLDYWARYNEEVLGAPRRLEWPATWTVLRHGRFFAERGMLEVRLRVRPTYELEAQRFKPYHLYQESSEAFRILAGVIDQFVALCKERGEKPLVLVFPMEHTVEVMKTYGRSIYEPLARRLEEDGIPHINFGPIFAREDFSGYYVRYNGHFSPAGNERVAREIIHRVRKHR